MNGVAHKRAPSADEYGRAVLAADARSLRIRAYNFEAKPVEATFRAWRLQPGEYRLTVDGSQATSMKVDRLPHLVRVTLPPAKEVTILVEKPRA